MSKSWRPHDASTIYVFVTLLALGIAVALTLTLVAGWQVYSRVGRAQAAKQSALADDPCWVCGGDGLRPLDVGVYECPNCRNVQGLNAQRYRNAQRRSAYVDLASEK